MIRTEQLGFMFDNLDFSFSTREKIEIALFLGALGLGAYFLIKELSR